MQYKCKVSSLNGLINEIIERPQDERTRELVKRGIIEPHTPSEPPAKKRSRKGGDKPEDAGADVERKEAD